MEKFKKTKVNGITTDFYFSYDKSDNDIINSTKKRIEKLIEDRGLTFRYANFNDIENISQFQKKIFHPHIGTLESEYEIFRIIKYGYGLLIESFEKELLACYTTIFYSSKIKEGYGIRVGVSDKIAGHNFAAELAKYATILAYENECLNFRALMSPTNFRSASNVLNYVGYYCDKFHRQLPSFGTRFEIILPLTLDTFYETKIDTTKILNFISKANMGEDYLLIKPDEIDLMEKIYSETDFKIIAFLKNGTIDINDYFFAIKPTTL